MDNEPKNMSEPLLSILIPVYNEQAYLNRIVRRVLDAPVPILPTPPDPTPSSPVGGEIPPPRRLKKELILVNDASTDRTSEVMAELEKEFPDFIRCFHQSPNQGKGAAVRRAIQEMSGDWAIIQDADLEYDPNEYPILLAPLLEGRADVVYGSRFATRTMRKVLFYHHKLGNLFLTHFSNFTTGLDLTDMETCYKAFRAEILKSIPLRSNRFGIEPEVTAKIAKRGLSVYEVPISYHGRRYSEGKKIGWKDGISAIWTILKYWLIDDCWDADETKSRQLLRTMEHSRNFYRHFIKKSLPFLGTRILQVGAGYGNLAKLLPQQERLTLAEADENHRKILRNSFDGNAIVDIIPFDPDSQNLSETTNPPPYDTIIAFDQLQRYADPEAALARFAERLLPGGRLILMVPANPKLFGFLDNTLGNRRRFRKKSLKKQLAHAGFTVEVSESFNRFGACLMRYWNWRKTTPGRMMLKIFDFTLPLAMFLERIGVWTGADLFVVAKK